MSTIRHWQYLIMGYRAGHISIRESAEEILLVLYMYMCAPCLSLAFSLPCLMPLDPSLLGQEYIYNMPHHRNVHHFRRVQCGNPALFNDSARGKSLTSVSRLCSPRFTRTIDRKRWPHDRARVLLSDMVTHCAFDMACQSRVPVINKSNAVGYLVTTLATTLAFQFFQYQPP